MTPTSLREQLARDEGYRQFAYEDSEGFWTVGIGRCIDRRRGKGLSLAEAEMLLENDIRDFTADVLVAIPWAMQLDEVRRDVLINMAFQLGTQGLIGFKRFLAAMKAGEWEAAAGHLLESKAATQAPLRFKRHALQIMSGERQ